ncbi:MAG: hypothetical protein Q8R29_02145 [bacterium]|nr:hypothetical protein [bacterium]
MKRKHDYVCPKCGEGLDVIVQGVSSVRKNSVEVVFECAQGPGKECDFKITVHLLFSTEGEILWPSQDYVRNLFRPEYEQAFVMSKKFGQYPEVSGPFFCEEDAIKQMNYLLYAFPESYCREFKNNLDYRTKLWILKSSQVPRWVLEHMKKVMFLEPWADFRPQDITNPVLREVFLINRSNCSMV